MTAKRVSFDVMNLGRPSHFAKVEEYSKLATSPRTVTFNDKEFVRMLRERTCTLTDMYLGDFSENSDDSEDEFAFMETLTERVQRMAFENRRKKHYTEFTTVKLARKLISDEWLDMSESESSFIHTENEKSNEECYECGETTEARHESIEIPRDTVTSNASNDSFREDSTPEPGSQPSHPCYRSRMDIAPNEAIPLEPVTPVSMPTSKTVSKNDIKDSKHNREFNPAAFPAFKPIPALMPASGPTSRDEYDHDPAAFPAFPPIPALMPGPEHTSRYFDDDDFFNFEAQNSREKLPAKQTRLLYSTVSRLHHVEPKRTFKITETGKNPFLLSSQEAPDEPTGTVKRSDSEKKKQRKVKGVLQISKRTNAKAV